MQNNRRPQPGGTPAEMVLLGTMAGLLAAVSALVWVSVTVGYSLAGREVPKSGFFPVVFGLLEGSVKWLPESTYVAVGVLVLLVVLAIVAAVLVRRRRQKVSRVDKSAQYLGRGRDIEALSRRNATDTARRLGVEADEPGLTLGRTVGDDQTAMTTWEDMLILIAGPRTQKTTAYGVPSILSAPGACLVTSNKRDVVDATRGPRSEKGPVLVFDPQGIAREPETWWWNPLDYVTDEVQAAKLAEHFASGSRAEGARTDAYFEPAGQKLLSSLLLAAALDRRPITDVYRWLTRPTDETSVHVLTDHGYELQADQVAGVIQLNDKQRDGVFGSAQQMVECLTNRTAARWVTPSGPASRERFDAHDFVRSGGTLYSLSKEGSGTAGPLVTALTVAVVEAAEDLAVDSPGGRLATPLVGVLDEAANVCRWRQLPNLYSHYGSRGIVLLTILQSWSQGAEVWGEAGIKKLWSASNVRIYGGGVAEPAFLEDLAKLIGQYDRQTGSVTINHGGMTARGSRSSSTQLTRERIMDVDDLAALPKGRSVLLASGSRPTLIRTQPWMTGPHAQEVKASIAANDPQASRTLHEVEETVSEIQQEAARERRAG